MSAFANACGVGPGSRQADRSQEVSKREQRWHDADGYRHRVWHGCHRRADSSRGYRDCPLSPAIVLAALCGCEGITFNRTAAELDFPYEGIDFRGSYTIDTRGRMGNREVRPHFQTVRLEARVFTSESAERLREVVEETEAPVQCST